MNQLPCRGRHNLCLGGYDGCAYFLSIGTGAIEWCFPTGDAIKAACTTDEYGFAYATSYDRNIYKLDPKVHYEETAIIVTS